MVDCKIFAQQMIYKNDHLVFCNVSHYVSLAFEISAFTSFTVRFAYFDGNKN